MARYSWADFTRHQWFWESREGCLHVTFTVQVFWEVEDDEPTGRLRKTQNTHTWRTVGDFGKTFATEERIQELGRTALKAIMEADAEHGKAICSRYAARWHVNEFGPDGTKVGGTSSLREMKELLDHKTGEFRQGRVDTERRGVRPAFVRRDVEPLKPEPLKVGCRCPEDDAVAMLQPEPDGAWIDKVVPRNAEVRSL